MASTSREAREDNKEEEQDYVSGPLSVLRNSVKNKGQLKIHLRSGRVMKGHPRDFDRHFNMVLENVQETWTERPKLGKGVRGPPENKERLVKIMFVRGDGVVYVRPHTN